MPLKKWRSMDIFNFSPRENPIMESISNKFAEISQSHAGTLLRNRRLGSLGSVRNSEDLSPQKDDASDSGGTPLLQRTAIIQKDEKGYGLTVSGDNPVYVASVKMGGAAEKAGVQVGDKIIKVNGKLVTNSNHTEVVKMIRAGSYVALTLLGKPSNVHPPNRESIIEREPSSFRESSGSFRESIGDKITGPQPVDPHQAEKEKEIRQQKVNTIRVMYETVHEEYDKLRKDCKANPSDSRLQSKLQDKEKTLKILEAQLQSLPGIGTFTRDSQPPSINVDSESVTSETPSVSSLLPKKERKHMKHSSSPGAMYSPTEAQERSNANVCRSKSDVSTRKNALSEYSFGHQGYKRTESSPETASVPYTVSDLGSDSPYTSPSSSPTPSHNQNLDIDTITGDSGIEEGSQNSIVMSSKPQIIGMDDDDFASDDESTGDTKVFSDLHVLEKKPAHMAIFLHYVLNQHNPAPLLFYQMASLYSNAQGSCKDLKKWAYEIHSTFIVQSAPLRVPSLGDHIFQAIDQILTFRSEKEELLRSMFNNAQAVAKDDIHKLLEDLRQKKEQGLIEGSAELRDHMDKNEELRIAEKYLLPDLEKCYSHSDEDDKMAAQAWAIATFLRQAGLNKTTSHSNILERVPSFVTKDKQLSKFKFSGKTKTKSQKGHQFVLTHLYKQEHCLHCTKVLWGVGFQGYQCQTCEQCVHRQCVDDLEEVCSKKKKRASTALNVFKPKTSQATPMINDSEREQVSSPTSQTQPSVFTQPLKDPEDKEISAFKDSGHSVGSLVNRFETTSPEQETSGRFNRFGYSRRSAADFSPRITRKNAITPRQSRRPSMNQSLSVPPRDDVHRKNSDIGRSESMKGRGDTRDRPAKRSNSDLAMDENTLRAIQSPSSSVSSLRSMESPSTSMDTLTAQIQDDSDFDVEPELPSLKQVLGEDTVRKLKPKEKKRQDVINELFYTEKSHVRNLKIMDKLFYRPMLKEQSIPQEFTKSLFPNLETMIHLHGSLNNAMKTRRKEKSVINNVGDILLQRFDGEAGENFRNGCAIFCRNQSHTLETLKIRVRKEPKMAQLLSDAENNPLCQRLALKDIIPKQFMRLTKYPLLIENLLKYTQTNTEEYSSLERSLRCTKHILEYVNQAVKDCENHQRLIDLQRKIDKKSIDNSPEMEELRLFDLSRHKLLHDGALTWSLNNRKQIELHVVLLERAMVLLQKQDERLVLKLQSTQLVAGKTDSKKHSPLLWLNNVLARNDATDKKAFFVVNTSKSGPQIYKLVAGTAEEQRTWTKYITQASEAMKKNEINLKKKPPVQEEIPTEPPVQPGTENGDMGDIDSGTLVHPDDVSFSDPVINTAVQVITPLEKLRHNDEQLAAVLEERQGLIAELLNVNPNDVADKVQDVSESEEGSEDPQELIAACQHQTSEIVNMMRENTPPNMPGSGEQVESVEDLTLPIPMDRLRDMANRMNQILTNLLAQTRATADMTPMTQAAVNSRDEERDRLRKELKFAQEELNRLRRIQRLQMEAQKEKGEEATSEAGEEKRERPASIVSETSTVSESEGDENKEDSEQTDDQETEVTEDGMPGLPIEPEIVSESETLNEVSPGTMDTLVDTESALDLEEMSGPENEEIQALEEAEVEAVEEELHEMEPPEEDQMEDSDFDTPIVKIVAPENEDSDDEDEEDDGEKDLEENIEETDRSSRDVTDEQNGDGGDGSDERLTGETENVMDRLKVDANDAGDSDTDVSSDKRESGEVFHDAIEGQEERNSTEITEDPGGHETDNESADKIDVGSGDNLSSYDSETVVNDSENKQSNNNIDIGDSDVIQKQKDDSTGDKDENINGIQTDDTVKSLNESSEEV